MDGCPFDTRLARTPYLVIPKLALQAMPMAWRERLETLLAEADAAGMETPNYHVFRNDPVFTHAERADSEDDHSQVVDLFLVRPDPWADYRRGDIRALCPTFTQPTYAVRASETLSAAALLEGLQILGLPDSARLVVMKQNPADNYHWSASVGEFSVAEVRDALFEAQEVDHLAHSRQLMAEAAALFREYQAHHEAKASEAGRPEKAERNADIAARLEAALQISGAD